MTETPLELTGETAKKATLRDPVSGLIHLGAAVAALIGLIALLVMGWGNSTRELSLLIYGLSLILLFLASAAYHMVNSGPEVIKRLRRADHSAIYLLIAGTYTPICLSFFTGFWRWGPLAIVWIMAVVGVTVKLFIMAPRWVSAGIYLVMGWLSILAAKAILSAMPISAIVWLVAGGVLFTVGAVVYVTKKPDPWPGVFGFHEVWHIFVILGCLVHFILIAAFEQAPRRRFE
jgi:hemolysin III